MTTGRVLLYAGPRRRSFVDGPSLPVDILDFATVLFPDGLFLITGGKQVDKAEGSLDGGWAMDSPGFDGQK